MIGPHLPHTRGIMSSSAAATLHGKTQGFLPTRSPCNIHAAITMRFSGRSIPQISNHFLTLRQPSSLKPLSSPAGATLAGKNKVSCPNYLQSEAHATSMQPLQGVSQHHSAHPHLATHMATQHGKIDAAIPLRSATPDSKSPYHCAHTHKRNQAA